MRIIQRIVTKHGHPVPTAAYQARGPFPPELFTPPEMITDYIPTDSDIPEGGTAQNNFRPPKVFECSLCSVLVLEHDIPNHVCPEAEDSGSDA